MKVETRTSTGIIKEVGQYNETKIAYSYDWLDNILHLMDLGTHRDTSLVNLINISFKETVLNEIRAGNESTRCFIYQDGQVMEYITQKNIKGNSDFEDIQSDEMYLLDKNLHSINDSYNTK